MAGTPCLHCALKAALAEYIQAHGAPSARLGARAVDVTDVIDGIALLMGEIIAGVQESDRAATQDQAHLAVDSALQAALTGKPQSYRAPGRAELH